MRFAVMALSVFLASGTLPPEKVKEADAASACQVEQGGRDAILYNTATSIRFSRRHAVMGGFRFRGAYTRGCAPTFAMPADRTASVTRDLGAERSPRFQNWYAVFAAANRGDAEASVIVMPFLRVGSVTGRAATFMAGGERGSGLASYDWLEPDVLSGTDVLVISENGRYSGRITKSTASTGRGISLKDVGTLSSGDFILPAPPDYTNYLYIGTFYLDTKEVRNIYDSGVFVKARMAGIYDPAYPEGAVKSAVRINLSGYISPLATAAIFSSSGGLSTASPGQFAEYFDADGGTGHVIDERVLMKSTKTTEPYFFDNIILPFMYHQLFFYRNSGPIASSRIDSKIHVLGWIEP